MALNRQPVNHGPVAPAPNSGSLIGAEPPAGGLAAGEWPARYTGEVSLDQTSTSASPHGFALNLTGGSGAFAAGRRPRRIRDRHPRAAAVRTR